MGDPRVWGCQEHQHGEEELQNSFQEDSQDSQKTGKIGILCLFLIPGWKSENDKRDFPYF